MDMPTPRWIGWWFRGAAIYGVVALAAAALRPAPPGAFLYFYGFIGTAFAFQIAFWVIGGAPVRYRALMPAAVVEKLAFVVPVLVLAATSRLDPTTQAAGVVDLVLGIGFLIAWRSTRPA